MKVGLMGVWHEDGTYEAGVGPNRRPIPVEVSLTERTVFAQRRWVTTVTEDFTRGPIHGMWVITFPEGLGGRVGHVVHSGLAEFLPYNWIVA